MGPDSFDKSRFVKIFFIILGITETWGSFKLVLGRKTGKKIPASSRSELFEMLLPNSFALSDVKNSISIPWNRGGIADLPLLKTLLAICQKSWKTSFWEVMDSFFISICKYASLAASRWPFQRLLACLNFHLYRDLFCW